MTHNRKRHGITTLFGALNVLNGRIVGRCMKRIAIRNLSQPLRDAAGRRDSGSPRPGKIRCVAGPIIAAAKGGHQVLDAIP
jgi:hypothetical protein